MRVLLNIPDLDQGVSAAAAEPDNMLCIFREGIIFSAHGFQCACFRNENSLFSAEHRIEISVEIKGERFLFLFPFERVDHEFLISEKFPEDGFIDPEQIKYASENMQQKGLWDKTYIQYEGGGSDRSDSFKDY